MDTLKIFFLAATETGNFAFGSSDQDPVSLAASVYFQHLFIKLECLSLSSNSGLVYWLLQGFEIVL
jgi:hypothetical protein